MFWWDTESSHIPWRMLVFTPFFGFLVKKIGGEKMSFHGSAYARLALSLGCLVFGAGLLRANVTYGTSSSGNCIPFMCNDSGTSAGQSVDFQQVYSASGFAGDRKSVV